MKKTMGIFWGCFFMLTIFGSCGKKAPEYDLYIFNSKGENAQQFEAMCRAYEAETGVKVKNFSIGSGQDHSEPLNAEMNSRNKPVIYSIQGVKELVEWIQGGFVEDLAGVTDPAFAALASAIPPSLRLTTDGNTSFGIPYNVEGYGYIADTKLLGDIFGQGDVTNLAVDIKEATYDEWAALVTVLDSWIKNSAPAQLNLNGHTYNLAPAKSGLAVNLTGVFAVMGAEKWTYGDHFINVALNAIFTSPNDANNATEEKLRAGKGAFVDYAQALDLKTSHLAGKTARLSGGRILYPPPISAMIRRCRSLPTVRRCFLSRGTGPTEISPGL
ncbi:MAG: ABC transporter substrate-binding protein, partial [Spirochaetaceae bacterium]|nr:ABC transporter substrate-binding protein [Spirochaetaceae bacterium]